MEGHLEFVRRSAIAVHDERAETSRILAEVARDKLGLVKGNECGSISGRSKWLFNLRSRVGYFGAGQ